MTTSTSERTKTEGKLRAYKHIEHNQGNQQQVRSNQTQTGTNELMMTGKPNMGTEAKSDITPPPSEQARPAPYNIERGGGVGTLEASRDLEPGQVASRAVPVPGPTAEQAVWAAMADQGTQAGGTDCGAAATCDDSVSPTMKFDPAIHSAKLMYFFNDKLGSALSMTGRISSTNPHQNPSIKVRSSHVVR